MYTARHELTDRVVAFKVLNRRFCKREDIVRRARIEAKALARIDHPSVVRIFHAGDDAEVGLYIVMELVAGKSLRAIMHRAGKLGCRVAGRAARGRRSSPASLSSKSGAQPSLLPRLVSPRGRCPPNASPPSTRSRAQHRTGERPIRFGTTTLESLMHGEHGFGGESPAGA